MISDGKIYMTRKDIAEMLGVTKVTLHNWRNHKWMPEPDVKIGNIVRWESATIDRWLERRNRSIA